MWRWSPFWHTGDATHPPDPNVNGPDGVGFSASPAAYNGVVYVGHLNGHMYAIRDDGDHGTMLWKYPPTGLPALVAATRPSTGYNPSFPGIASSAAVVESVGPNNQTAVIFGAPDPVADEHGNQGDRLWAVDATTGSLIWKSPILANWAGNAQIGYSSPLIANGRVYVGISSHGDTPVIPGTLVSVRIDNGDTTGLQSTWFSAVNPRGGGIWSSPAVSPSGDVIITTGNSCYRGSQPPDCSTEPNPNHAPSMLRLDRSSGQPVWEFHPIPWIHDNDDDWASTPAIHLAGCAIMAVAHLKDGYTHAIDVEHPGPQVGQPTRRWTFPEPGSGMPPFTVDEGGEYTLRPAALWNDVVIVVTGGMDVEAFRQAGTHRLHALNACAPTAGRVRWWIQFSGVAGGPSVTRGIVYVGDSQGLLHVIADPTVSPARGQHCEYPLEDQFGTILEFAPGFEAFLCAWLGFREVPIPAERTVPLEGGVRTTPALARGRVYVTTDAGHIYALATP